MGESLRASISRGCSSVKLVGDVWKKASPPGFRYLGRNRWAFLLPAPGVAGTERAGFTAARRTSTAGGVRQLSRCCLQTPAGGRGSGVRRAHCSSRPSQLCPRSLAGCRALWFALWLGPCWGCRYEHVQTAAQGRVSVPGEP